MARTSQPSLAHDPNGIVNVGSVRQYSPFRYAGGKTWLVPQVRRWLASLAYRPEEFIEPFAGGASVGLTVGTENLADHVTLVELDSDVCAVWQAIFAGDAGRLADRIISFRVNPRSVQEILGSRPRSRVDRAFRTIVRNRVLHGGILAPGASVMKAGENGKGLGSRWYPETLARRIISIGAQRRMFAAAQRDGLDVIQENARRERAVFFVDPPYTVAGRRLYTHFALDHAELFARCARIAGDFLITYDDADEIRILARRHNFETATVPMKSRQHAVKNELLIGKDLGWLRTAVSARLQM